MVRFEKALPSISLGYDSQHQGSHVSEKTKTSATRWVAICIAWLIGISLFAVQWYAYDASRATAEPFLYYVGWSGYICVFLTPAAIWLAWRFPTTASQWRRHLPLHIGASVLLTCLWLSLEAYLAWVRGHNASSAGPSFRHYFRGHAQISLAAYWVFVAATLFYRARQDALAGHLRSARLEAQLSEARLEALSRQLRPHFLFNTLQAATTLVKDDPDSAEEVLLRLSDLLRVSLRESEQHEIPLQRELEILDHYISIQTCRFGDRLRFDLHMDQDVLGCAVPSLLLQPLVENAVLHGIGMHKGGDTISISGHRNGDSLQLKVLNLTSSLRTSAEQRAGQGVGLTATCGRLEQLYGDRASLRLRNVQPAGVCAEVTIPFRIIEPGQPCVDGVGT